MAQPIHCDYGGCGAPHDVLVSRAFDGETTAWCFAHYVEVCRSVVEAADAQEADATAAEVEARLGVGPSSEPSTDPEHVVRRGTSRSRAAYEARRRSKSAGDVSEGTPGDNVAPGASMAPTEDAGEPVATA